MRRTEYCLCENCRQSILAPGCVPLLTSNAHCDTCRKEVSSVQLFNHLREKYLQIPPVRIPPQLFQ